MSRIRRGSLPRQRVRAGAPDPALTPNAGLAVISELCDRLGVISALDAAVGPVKAMVVELDAGKARAVVNELIARKDGAGSIREALTAFAEAEGVPL